MKTQDDNWLKQQCLSAGLPAESKLCRICMGLVYGPDKTDRFRAIWGLPPLFGEEKKLEVAQPRKKRKLPPASAKPVAKQPSVPNKNGKKARGCGNCGGGSVRTIAENRTNGYGPGSQLLKLWKDMPHCEACESLAADMDSWGVAGCRKRMDWIVESILPRAKEWMENNKPLLHKILSITNIENVSLRTTIGKCVKTAINTTEDLYNRIPESSVLAAVVPFFNFMRSDSRIQNYHKCVSYLRSRGFPVYVAEAVLEGDDFQVPLDNRVQRFVVRDPLFIKESLFNKVLSGLPQHYSRIAWLDADFVFDRPDVVDAALEALDKWPIVQIFRTIEWLDQQAHPERGRLRNYAGAGFQATMGNTHIFGRWPGGAWAARREVLEEIGGLYDGYPAGSCDVLALAGFLGNSNPHYFQRYSESTVRHYMPWHKKTFSIVKGNVGYVDTVASHLYHGVFKNRQYKKRHQKLKELDFDPAIHLERNADGINQLSPDCPDPIKEWLRLYMLKLRQEP